MATNWKEIWENRNIATTKEKLQTFDENLEALLAIDGFDSGTGKISAPALRTFVDKLTSDLDIQKNDSVFEVGCGAGAFLFPFYKNGNDICGMDYSDKLIEHCNSVFNSDSFKACEAKDLEVFPQYDFVFSFSVFFYFPDLTYAENVLKRMFQKAKKAVVILDIPDLAKKEECEGMRRMQYPPGEYEKKYQGLNHLYYSREWFIEQSEKLNCSSIQVSDQNIEDYFNSKFRFNIILNK